MPINLIAWPDEKAERNDYALEIPLLGSLILTHSLNGEVKGLKEVPASERPPVLPVFLAFRVMVGCGILLLAVAFTGLYLRWRGRLYTTRWYQIACMGCVPLGFIATLAGWVVTEVGRQPYVIYGHFRTAEAVSPLATGAVASSMAVAFVLYNCLLLGFFWYAGRLAWRGPMSGLPTHPAVPLATVAAALGQTSPTPEGAK